MEYREEKGFLYRVVPEGIEIVYAPAAQNRVEIPAMIADREVVALAEDYHDDLPAMGGGLIVLPRTLRRLPAGVICHGVRIGIDEENPVFYTDGHALFLRDAQRGVTLHTFFDNALQEYDVPEGVACVGESAFAYACVQMVTLPASLREIGAHAFFGAALSLIDLPAQGVERIGPSKCY